MHVPCSIQYNLITYGYGHVLIGTCIFISLYVRIGLPVYNANVSYSSTQNCREISFCTSPAKWMSLLARSSILRSYRRPIGMHMAICEVYTSTGGSHHASRGIQALWVEDSDGLLHDAAHLPRLLVAGLHELVLELLALVLLREEADQRLDLWTTRKGHP